VSVRDAVRRKLDRLRDELARNDLDRSGRALRVAELSLMATPLWPAVAVGHDRFYELGSAPKLFRGLRDLRVRVAGPADTAALAALDTTPPKLIDERFARGDVAYVGELDGRMLAHSWFHRGPAPFAEDAPDFPRWDVPGDAFWSYHAFTLPEARTSGVFVKLFQTALRELIVDRGATRVRCRVKIANAPSIMLHERFGFELLGTLSALLVPGARFLSWRGPGGARRWVERRTADTVMTLPPGSGA
jgi:GNAT superfamily N-acetyltransferase